MRGRHTQEDLLNSDRAFFQMIKDYLDGRFTQPWLKLYRARVMEVGTRFGQLEENPPSPIGSIKARIYTDGLDYNLPDRALNVYYPMFPAHLQPPVSVGEHVYVVFEDSNFSSGLWVTTVPGFSNLNYGNPDERTSDTSDASNVHDPAPNNEASQSVIVPEQYGGASTNTTGRDELPENFEENTTTDNNPWEGKRVLYIGDSMVGGADTIAGAARPRQSQGPSSYYLNEYLRRDYGASFFHAAGRVGWGVLDWWRGRGSEGPEGERIAANQPSVAELVSRYRPNIVLCTLGGNDAGRDSGSRDYRQAVETLWNQMNEGVEFAIWCGPPAIVRATGRRVIERGSAPNITEAGTNEFNEDRALVGRNIREVVGRAHYIDVRDITTNNTEQRSGDGVHFRLRAPVGQEWARRFIQRGITLGS